MKLQWAASDLLGLSVFISMLSSGVQLYRKGRMLVKIQQQGLNRSIQMSAEGEGMCLYEEVFKIDQEVRAK